MMDDLHKERASAYLERRISLRLRMGDILRLYAALGVLISIFGIGYLVYSRLEVSLSQQDKLALLASLGGAMISIISASAAWYLKANSERSRLRYTQFRLATRFLETWGAFEEAAKRALAKDDTAEISVREILTQIRANPSVKSTDLVALDEALRVRNGLVHSPSSIDPEEVSEALNALLRLLATVDFTAWSNQTGKKASIKPRLNT